MARQTWILEISGETSFLQVGYVWLHEASRELADGLPAPWSKTLQARLVQVASGAFSAFNDGVVTYPPRCKVRMQLWEDLPGSSDVMPPGVCALDDGSALRPAAGGLIADSSADERARVVQGMSRIDWANLLAEASAIEGWQLGPADQEAAYARMIQHSAVAGQVSNVRRPPEDPPFRPPSQVGESAVITG